MSKRYNGHLYNISKEDLYNQGIGLSNTYNYNNPNSDGSCCSMVAGDTIDHVPVKYFTPKVGVNPRMFIPPVIPPRTVEYGYWNYPSTMPINAEPLQDITSLPIEDTMLASHLSRINPDDEKYSELFKQTPTRVYDIKDFSSPENKLFLQDVEPNVFSYSEVQDPINSNLGISYTPVMPVKVRDQICSPIGSYPLYSRIDPQLVRDDGPLGLKIEQPKRGEWSAKYSNLEAGKGSFDESDIYDPRFTGAGDAYRSYSDINLGQVGYYYSDIDSTRAPNYVMRNKIDHVDYTDPNNKTSPYYRRNASLEDIKGLVESAWTADEIDFRENLLESLMRKRNSELWQLRQAPISRAARNLHPITSGGSAAR